MRDILVDSHNHTRNRRPKHKQTMEQTVSVQKVPNYMYEFFHQYPRLSVKVFKILVRLNCIHKYFENCHRDFFMKSSGVTKFLGFILENLELLI